MTSGSVTGVPLTLSARAFKEIVDHSLVGTLLVENEKIVYANACSAKIFGRSIDELIGFQLDQLIHPNDRRLGNERHRQRAAGRNFTPSYSIRALRPDGTIRELQTQSSTPTIDGRRLVMISIVDATERNQSNSVLNRMAEAIGSKIGEEFFSSLVLNLALSLNVDYAFVAEVCDDGKSLRMIAVAADGALSEPITYAMAETPCQSVMGGSLCWYPSDVQRLYPNDHLLVTMGVNSYAGLPLRDSNGRGIGLLTIMNRGELAHEESREAAIEIYAVRAAAELERIRAERASRAAHAYLDNLIETANVMIVELDIEGRATRVNRMVEELSGYSRDDLLGKKWFDLMLPESRRERGVEYMENLRTGRLRQINEGPIRRRDGSERIIAWRNSEIRNSDGEIVGSLSFGADITERIRVERERARLQEALAVVAEEWQRTFDAVNTPILVIHRDGSVVRVNRAACDLSSLEETQILGKNVADIRPSEPWQTAAQMVKYIADERAGTAAETRDELGSTWDITVAHFAGDEDEAERYILVFWNITGIVELQESLRRSETMSAMGTIVAGVAHEVRNPLFGISATLDAYAEELSRPGYQECVAALRAEVERLRQVMQELLEYGKPAALNIARGSLSKVIEEARAHCARQGVKVELSLADDLPDLLMDRGRLRQVFENLIDNAAKLAPNSTVRVSASVVIQGGGRWIEGRVEDDGPGFVPDDLDRVFEPFFSKRVGGTGLGLSIVQRIVEEHSGRVFAENRREGGACVRLRLPIGDEKASHP